MSASVLPLAFLLAAAAPSVDEGRRLLNEGRLPEAISVLQAVSAADPANAPAWNALGAALNRAERYEEALAAAERAVALDPIESRYRFNRGLVYSEHGRFEEALRDFDEALAQRPGFAPALTERGAALALLGRIVEARSSWAEALAADPTYVWSHFYRGIAAIVEGEFAAARSDLDTVVRTEDLLSARLWQWVAQRRAGGPAPSLPSQAEWPGPIARHLRDEITAAELVDQATRSRLPIDDRRLAVAWYFIAQKHLVEGRTADARRAFERAVAIRSPRHAERAGAEAELRRLPG